MMRAAAAGAMMNSVRKSSDRLDGLIPYDAKNLSVEVFLSANENSADVPAALKQEIAARLESLPFNRYPDPLAHGLRSLIAEANGLDEGCVLMGNGGDEQLFNIFLAWGGSGRKCLNMPPTFSVYAANAHLTGTEMVDIARKDDFSIDEEAVIARVGEGDIDIVIVPSPNNPTGKLAPQEFIERLLEASDALVLVDEAYFEFSRLTCRPLLEAHKNLVILRTFSKAFSLAGVRIGYIMADEAVIREFIKVRQPYSVDAVSQLIAEVVYENRAQFEPAIEAIISNREQLASELAGITGVTAYPSDSNYILFHVDGAHEVWQALLEEYSVLVRDFSRTRYIEDCLRVTVGNEQENRHFIEALSALLKRRQTG